MKRILLVINARQPQLPSVDFACRLAVLTQSRLTGLFVENLYDREPGAGGASFQKESDTIITTDTDHAITLFVRECASRQVAAAVLVSRGDPIQEVLRESRYSDLLVVDPGISFYGDTEQLPSHFTKEILANAECPVLLAPEKETEIEEVVFCYNRSASSVFAFKQFTYLLPEFKNKKALLLEVKRFGDEDSDDDHERVVEWLRVHYDRVE